MRRHHYIAFLLAPALLASIARADVPFERGEHTRLRPDVTAHASPAAPPSLHGATSPVPQPSQISGAPLAPYTIPPTRPIPAADPALALASPVPASGASPFLRLLVPALELPALHVLVWGSTKSVGMEFSNISADTMRQNIEGPWVWDNDNFWVNQIGHPYQGALPFMAARSAGLPFWAAAPYTVASSVAWELLMEAEPPSINDLITTSVGGIVFGEVLQRSARMLRDSSLPGWLGGTLAFVLNPFDTVNEALLGPHYDESLRPEPFFARAYVGAGGGLAQSARTDGAGSVAAFAGLELLHGVPGDPRARFKYPLDHFEVQARVGYAHELETNLSVRGLVLGKPFEVGPVAGLGGLFAGYDFVEADPSLRLSTVTVGPGVSVRHAVKPGVALRSTLVVGGVPIGHTGHIDDIVDERDFERGIGLQVTFDAHAVAAGIGRAGVRLRSALLDGSRFDDGFQRTHTLAAHAELLVGEMQGLGAELQLAANRSDRGGLDSAYDSMRFLLYWTVLSDGFDSLVY